LAREHLTNPPAEKSDLRSVKSAHSRSRFVGSSHAATHGNDGTLFSYIQKAPAFGSELFAALILHAQQGPSLPQGHDAVILLI